MGFFNFVEAIVWLIGELLSWILSWRMALCLGGGIVLAVFVVRQIEAGSWEMVAVGAIMIPAFILGWRWNASH